MKIRTSLITIILILMTMGYLSLAFGAISEEEASKLGGPLLTPIGAERAGNKDGTIPEWTGVPIPSPKNFKPGSGVRPDPFADEKPLFSINQKNMDKYSDKLSEGVKTFMKRYPDYRIDVYKTHRTMVFPKWYYDQTKKSATKCQVINDDKTLSGRGCHGGTPFPIPKAGIELYWNHAIRFQGEANTNEMECYNITTEGKVSISTLAKQYYSFVWNDLSKEDDNRVQLVRTYYVGPARRVGEGIVISATSDYAGKGATVWQYLPGQRRVRLAPDFCCDTPSAATGGASTIDDAGVVNGTPERFTWNIIGKKEMYIPYNANKIAYYQGDVNKAILPKFLNPDLIRWELHRVWILEAKLKPGKRHVYYKRVVYLDEDTFGAVMSDNYDKRGAFYRTTIAYPTYSYDAQAPFDYFQTYYDVISNSYAVYQWPRLTTGFQYIKPPRESFFSADALAGGGMR